MKKIAILSLFAILCTWPMICSAQNIKKSNLRVLYVGGAADYDEEGGPRERGADCSKSVTERMVSFEKMLNTYFTHVTVVHANDYTQQMSYNYDVTVLDGTPQPIVPLFQDATKGVYMNPAYFTEDFSKPVVTIGQISALNRRIGVKNDWY